MFGPVRMTSWHVVPFSVMSFGTNASPRDAVRRSTTGCRASTTDQLVAVVHVRLDVVVDRGVLGQRREDVERGQRARGRLDARRFGRRPRVRSRSKISSSRSRMRSSAPSTFSSYSFSAGVMKRSPPAIVCLRW